MKVGLCNTIQEQHNSILFGYKHSLMGELCGWIMLFLPHCSGIDSLANGCNLITSSLHGLQHKRGLIILEAWTHIKYSLFRSEVSSLLGIASQFLFVSWNNCCRKYTQNELSLFLYLLFLTVIALRDAT